MIRFSEQPDEIFLTILHEAMDEEQGYLEHSPDDDGFFEASYPLSSRHFTLALACQTLEQLRTASEAEDLYQLTDYHWELLYEMLRGYSALFNDSSAVSVLPERYGIEEIDFSWMIQNFFWDTDFLMSAETMMALSMKDKAMMGLSQETFGLTQGLIPHPDELQLKIVPSGWKEARMQDSARPLPSRIYPCLED